MWCLLNENTGRRGGGGGFGQVFKAFQNGCSLFPCKVCGNPLLLSHEMLSESCDQMQSSHESKRQVASLLV